MSTEARQGFDDKTRREFIEMGIDVDALEQVVIEISAQDARYNRIKEAITSGDMSMLNDDDVFIALNMIRGVDTSSSEVK